MPIIGHGDIASVLKDRRDRLYFASGVSNSQEIRQSEFEREVKLLLDQDINAHLIYFSSLSVFWKNTPYTRHKLRMEVIVRGVFKRYTIVRLGNITWGNNPKTIINFLKDKIQKDEPYEVRDEYKYLVDKNELLHWLDKIPEWSTILTITGKRIKVAQIVEEIKQGKL